MSTLILVAAHSEDDKVESTRFMLREEGDVDVIASTEEYQKSFPLYGTWEGWITHVAQGTDYLSRLPVFTKYVTIDTTLGRANASIIEKALALGKECCYFDGKTFQNILSVHRSGEDWSNGWEIVTL